MDALQPDNNLEILYQDEYLLAVNKPAGIIVHADGTQEPSLTEVVREKLRALESPSQIDLSQVQALNRLDRETTGIVLFSLKKETQPQFDQLIASKELSKEYLAAVKGTFEPNKVLIDKAIGKEQCVNEQCEGSCRTCNYCRLDTKRFKHCCQQSKRREVSIHRQANHE